MNIKITEEVRKMYARICPTSTDKCESFAELNYKIQRMLDLGKKRTSNMRNLVIKYYHNEIVIDKEGKIIRMYANKSANPYAITEGKKTRHYNNHHKVVV